MPRFLLLLAFVVFALWMNARARSLGRMTFERGIVRTSKTKLGALSFEVEDVVRQIAFTGRLDFRNDRGRVEFRAEPSLSQGEAQGLKNLLSQFQVRGGRVVRRGPRPHRGVL